MPSHAGDNVAESCWLRRCRDDLVVTQCRCRVRLPTILSSHAHDDAIEATWSRFHVDAESCWQRCCRGDFAVGQCRCRVMLAIMLLSHTGDDAADVTWPRCDVDAESCW
jgi:hypothetical protein